MTRPNNASPGIPRQGLGQLELVPGLPLMLLCGLDLRGIATRRDLSQEPERAGLGASLLELIGER